MRKIVLLLIIGTTALLSSCRKDFDTVPSNGGLAFSKQTVYLDTIFTGISSSTYMLKVYNTSNDDISIPAIRLEKGDASKYRLMVDGMTGLDGNGKYFPNVEILAKDSLFIFIETTVDITETEADFTYNDRILFGAGTTEQAVNLVTLIQDAHFIFPNRDLNGVKEVITLAGQTQASDIEGHTLTTPEELTWTNDKPWVVYGFAHVPAGQTLTIQEGTKVHFHDGAGIIVDQNAHIVIDGNPSVYDSEGNLVDDNEVTFEGDRLEPAFAGTPGQWRGVIILSTSGNSIDHLILKNGFYGIQLPGDGAQNYKPQVSITNSQVVNMVNFGILGVHANISAENLLASNIGQAGFAGIEGGDYNLLHCSLNNNWPSTSQLTVLFDNYYEDPNTQVQTDYPLTLSVKNSIIYNSNRVGFVLNLKDGTTVNTNDIAYNFIKFNDSGTGIENDPQYAFIRDEQNGNRKNIDPEFNNPNRNQLYIFTTSAAATAGNTDFITSGSTDYFGTPRATIPGLALGAFNAFEP
ncbi:hypothetical protein [Flavobacterium caeni]|uniref:Right handed beta helix region n=1 Tax=Flavobacterium caeni TaxID=490189 RepID=A0A1G5CG96_9FLAO|nr:hypothetical protein [Flavobacterium caeni]SCY01356.1 hypothetical protein SAMN02927903_00531 [Flavobacterium caeni]